MTDSDDRYLLQRQARAKRVARLRSEGVSVKETASRVGCERDQVRSLQLLGQRLMAKDDEIS